MGAKSLLPDSWVIRADRSGGFCLLHSSHCGRLIHMPGICQDPGLLGLPPAHLLTHLSPTHSQSLHLLCFWLPGLLSITREGCVHGTGMLLIVRAAAHTLTYTNMYAHTMAGGRYREQAGEGCTGRWYGTWVRTGRELWEGMLVFSRWGSRGDFALGPSKTGTSPAYVDVNNMLVLESQE